MEKKRITIETLHELCAICPQVVSVGAKDYESRKEHTVVCFYPMITDEDKEKIRSILHGWQVTFELRNPENSDFIANSGPKVIHGDLPIDGPSPIERVEIRTPRPRRSDLPPRIS